MKLFITIEAERAEETGIDNIMTEVRKKLSFLSEDTDAYGTEFNDISIIPVCVSEEMWQTLGWKERKLISRNKKEADIRLKMDYHRFINETDKNKYLLFTDIIIKSVCIVNDKSKGDFKGDKLINDILKALDISKEDLNNLQ